MYLLHTFKRREEIHSLHMNVSIFKEHKRHHHERNSLNAEDNDCHHHHAGSGEDLFHTRAIVRPIASLLRKMYNALVI